MNKENHSYDAIAILTREQEKLREDIICEKKRLHNALDYVAHNPIKSTLYCMGVYPSSPKGNIWRDVCIEILLPYAVEKIGKYLRDKITDILKYHQEYQQNI